MPNTREIKRRIKSVRNIRQITRAMQLVAASKMRRAQRRAADSDAYAYGALDILENLTRKAEGVKEHIFWKGNGKEIGKQAIILVAANRGFCGGLNISLFSKVAAFAKKIKQTGDEAEIITVGIKGRILARKTGLKIVADFSGLGDRFGLKDIFPLVRVAVGDYRAGGYKRIHLAFTRYVNALAQKPEIRQILPIEIESFKEIAEIDEKAKKQKLGNGGENGARYIFEPTAETTFERLVPHLLEIEIYKAILEHQASEHSARMIAMKNATEKAGELIDDLNLAYNQARQAAITREIAEVSAGAVDK